MLCMMSQEGFWDYGRALYSYVRHKKVEKVFVAKMQRF